MVQCKVPYKDMFELVLLYLSELMQQAEMVTVRVSEVSDEGQVISSYGQHFYEAFLCQFFSSWFV